MSAWGRLVSAATTGEELTELSDALREIQTETARRLARTIRETYPCPRRALGGICRGSCCIATAADAADLIEPEDE